MRCLDQLSVIQQSLDEFAEWVYTTKYTSCNTTAPILNFRPSAHMCVDKSQLILLSPARFLSDTKLSQHVTAALKSLHWLLLQLGID